MPKTIESGYQDKYKWMEHPRKGISETIIIVALVVAVWAGLGPLMSLLEANDYYVDVPFSWLGPLVFLTGIVTLVANPIWELIGWFARRRNFHMLSYWYNVDLVIGGKPWLALELLIGGAAIVGINFAIFLP